MKKMAILAASSALIFAACSGDETTNVTEVNESTGLDVVAKGEKMPACDTANVGQMIFVTDSSAVYYCADGEWTTLNGKDGAAGKDGEDGKDGTNGKNGDNGKDGKDLVAVYDTVTTEFLNQEMLEAGDYGYFTDVRDNKVYRTIVIGEQIWMAQNLDYYVNGAASYCYEGVVDSCKKYGRLYTWAVAMNLDEMYNDTSSVTAMGADSILVHPVRGICPEGWRIPDTSDIRIFLDWVIAKNMIEHVDEDVTVSLKSSQGWAKNQGSNRYGFSSIGSGLYVYNVLYDGFDRLLQEGTFWLSNETSKNMANRALISEYSSSIVYDNAGGNNKKYGFSVRCLKD